MNRKFFFDIILYTTKRYFYLYINTNYISGEGDTSPSNDSCILDLVDPELEVGIYSLFKQLLCNNPFKQYYNKYLIIK